MLERQQELGDDRDFIEKTVDDSTQLETFRGKYFAVSAYKYQNNHKRKVWLRAGIGRGLTYATSAYHDQFARCMRL